MLSSGAGGNNMNLMNGLIPNLQKAQNNANINNLNGLMGMGSLPLKFSAINTNNLNNHLLQQQNLQLLNMNNQMLPMQLAGMQYVNPMQSNMNLDLLSKLQGGVGMNNMQNINSMMGNQQFGMMGGMPINQRMLLEGLISFYY